MTAGSSQAADILGAADLMPSVALQQGAIGILHIPEFARLSEATLSQMRRALERWRADPAIYGVAIRPWSLPQPMGAGTGNAAIVGDAVIVGAHQLIWELDRFPKPVVALLSGAIGGLIAAAALVVTHRVADASFSLTFDALRHHQPLGWGTTAALARLPAGMGAYLALSGRILQRADAFRLGFITHCIVGDDFEDCLTEFAAADCVDPIFDRRHHDPGTSVLADAGLSMASACIGSSLAEILNALRSVTGPEQSSARRLADDCALLDPALVDLALLMLRRPDARAVPPRLRSVLIEDQRVALWASANQRHLGHGLPPKDWLAVPVTGEATLAERDFIPSVPV